MAMYKYWITYTIASVIFLIICLTIVIFNNKPLFRNFWEEALLIVSIVNLALAFNYYRQQKDQFARNRGKGDHK